MIDSITRVIDLIFKIIILIVSSMGFISSIVFIIYSLKNRQIILLMTSLSQSLLCIGIILTVLSVTIPIAIVMMGVGLLGLVIQRNKSKSTGTFTLSTEIINIFKRKN